MFAKTAQQVNPLMTIAFALLILTCVYSSALAEECSESWQPDNPRTCCDDLFYTNLATSLGVNTKALEKTAPQQIRICNQTFSTQAITQAYTQLQAYIPSHTEAEISNYIGTNFNFCSANPVLITGYYEPTVAARLKPTPQFPIPLYTAPRTNRPKKFNASRKAIETTDILQGFELAYVRDLFTAFTIHVQGSAQLTFADGSQRQLHYQSSNGRPYTSVGRVLIDRKLIPREQMSMQAIKKYTQDHPQKTAELLHNNERFIYFSLDEPTSEPMPPSGSFNIPLTPHRSIALDPKIYPPGLLLHLQGTLPVVTSDQQGRPSLFHRRDFSRFMLNQDSGSAIKGERRVDLFMGRGETAEIIAGEMAERGCLRVLLPK